jgi:hypothetical protein
MKFIFISAFVTALTFSAWAQDPAHSGDRSGTSSGGTPEEMTLVGKDSGTPVQLESQGAKKVSKKKKGSKSEKDKKSEH